MNTGAVIPAEILSRTDLPIYVTDTAEWGTCQNTAYTARLINRVVSLL